MSANCGAVGLPLEQLETPALCLDLDAYRRNLARMAGYIIGRHRLNWRPHMKGQKAPELAAEAVAAGAIGVTCATVYEAEVMVNAAIPSVLVANQAAGGRKLARLARLERRGRVIAATDSFAHARALAAAAASEGVVIPVVVEVNVGMNRCGIAPGQPVVELARWISGTPGLRFTGLMGWEG
ncbi:MAG: DSD1 family PLP-dependent enzyme, partial [Acidobacteria bacterium]|nr:DSD1 family PLP-dependent enzyme [Acidobacteriota bacterium]